ncbi:MAG TPA: hypothetical protein VNF29_11855, partial [Candidatus Binataceae bacterium]|nr:hypothetical protein [Candidatus Binataceae bacterium]
MIIHDMEGDIQIGDTFRKVSIVARGRSCPRILRFLLKPAGLLPLYRSMPIRRSGRAGVFQQPATSRPNRSN